LKVVSLKQQNLYLCSEEILGSAPCVQDVDIFFVSFFLVTFFLYFPRSLQVSDVTFGFHLKTIQTPDPGLQFRRPVWWEVSAGMFQLSKL